jgi:hypothetical protein
MQTYDRAHTSTVAWSCYNWLSTQDGPRSREQILEGARVSWDSKLTLAACNEALDELVKRALLSEELQSDGVKLLDLRDKQRRSLVTRDRGADGWSGWRIGPRPQRATIPIDEALKGS